MRMRMLPAVFLLLATTATAAPPSVLLQRYDATLASGAHSALCVIPPEVDGPAGRARFICFYAVPGQRLRDDTREGHEPVVAPAVDPNFNVWFTKSLQGAVKCDLTAALNGSGIPTQAALTDACRSAKYAEQAIAAGSSEDFVENVHKAAAALLPAPPPKQETTPSVKKDLVADSAGTSTTGTVNQRLSGPAAGTTTVSTTERSTTTTGTSTMTDTSTTATDTSTTTQTSTTDTADAGVQKPEVAGSSDGTSLWLLVLIAIMVGGLLFERLWQAWKRKKLLDHELASDEQLGKATNLEQALTLAARQRDVFKAELESAHKKLTETRETLREIDQTIGATESERSARLGALNGYEKWLMRLGQVDVPGPAITAIERKVKGYDEIAATLPADARGANAAKYLKDCADLVTRFRLPFWSNATDPESAGVAAEEVRDGLLKLCKSAGYSGSVDDDSARVVCATLEQALVKLRGQIEERQSQVDRQNDEIAAVGRLIAGEWPGTATVNLAATASELAERMQTARAAAVGIGIAAGQGIDAMVSELAVMVGRERNASRGVQEMLLLLRDYIALPDVDAPTLSGVVSGELSKSNRILRLAIAAALPELRRRVAASRGDGDGNSSILNMLRIPEITVGLDGFLNDLWNYHAGKLWDVAITDAFSGTWLHKLFRAEAVLRTYFQATKLAELGDVLTLTGWAFRHAIAAAGYEVDRVQLLAAPSAAMDPMHNPPIEFRNCPDIRRRVQAALKTHRDGGFAVDVDTVGIRNGNQVLKRGGVVLASRIDWED